MGSGLAILGPEVDTRWAQKPAINGVITPFTSGYEPPVTHLRRHLQGLQLHR